MELDDFKRKTESVEIGPDSVTTDLHNFKRSLRRNLAIESIVAALSFMAVVAIMVSGHVWYPHIVAELLPDHVFDPAPRMNAAMYSAMVAMALYSIMVPIRRRFADNMNESMSWSVASRIEAEIERMENQKRLWSTAHLWSIGPAALIGTLFFWGLNASLTGSWVPSMYLWAYFGFAGLSVLGGIWLKNDMIKRNFDPLLQRLYGARNEIAKEAMS